MMDRRVPLYWKGSISGRNLRMLCRTDYQMPTGALWYN
jgi:hypothetical protein